MHKKIFLDVAEGLKIGGNDVKDTRPGKGY